MRTSLLAGSLAFVMLGAQAQQQAGQEVAQQAIPDAPKPQTTLPGLGSITPGKGASTSSAAPSDPDAGPGATLPSSKPADAAQAESTDAPQIVASGQAEKIFTIVGQGVNFVEVPFIVKDSKGRLVAGLSWRDVQVYENGARQKPTVWNVTPRAMSVALVIDQSMTQDNMSRVNTALGALQGAFAPYDSVALFTYNNGPRLVTDFTGSQSARLVQAIETSKTTGRQPIMAGDLDGPLSQTTVINNQNFDPNTAANRGHSTMQVSIPKEVHTLNDAILAAATLLSKSEPGRLRVIYVISDGKEYGSTAKYKDVVRYLQTNKIGVYGTLVGDSSLPVLGFLDGIHLPMMMRDNILPAYAKETGGNFDAEFRIANIEKSFAKIAEEVRTQYTIGYNSRESFIDGKYRKLEVVIMNHGNDLSVIAKQGYYPSAMDQKLQTVAH